MKKDDKKKEKKELDPEVIERFMEGRRRVFEALNERLNKEGNRWAKR